MDFHLNGLWGWVIGIVIMFTASIVVLTGAIIILRILFEWIVDNILRVFKASKLLFRYAVYHEEFWNWYKKRNRNL